MTIATASDPIADELWREARAWFAETLRDVVSPVEIALALARKARAAIKRRLVHIETLLAKLLLIEAVRHPSWNAGLSPGRSRSFASAKPGRPACAPAARSIGVTHTHAAPCAKSGDDKRACVSLSTPEDPANPETWRVRFCLHTPREHPRAAGGPRVSVLGPALLVRDIWRENKRRALIDRLRQPIPANAQAKAHALARRFEAIRRVLADPRRAIATLARKLQSLGKRARAFARRIAFARAPRAKPTRATFANALVHAHYASLKLPCDTS